MDEIKVSAQLAKQLKEYNYQVAEGIDNACRECAKGAAAELRQTSPERTGAYRHGWTSRKTADDGPGRKEYTVYNKDKPQLTHPLEDGHKSRKETVFVKARPHVGPVAKKWTKIFVGQCEEVCKNAGK